jgi:hypothetical protein
MSPQAAQQEAIFQAWLVEHRNEIKKLTGVTV